MDDVTRLSLFRAVCRSGSMATPTNPNQTVEEPTMDDDTTKRLQGTIRVDEGQ